MVGSKPNILFSPFVVAAGGTHLGGGNIKGPLYVSIYVRSIYTVCM